MRGISGRACAVLLALGLGVGPAAAQQAPLPPVEAFFSNPDIRSVSLSPDGAHLAMLMGGAEHRDALYVVPVADPSRGRMVAGFRDYDISFYRWIDDSRLIHGLYDSHEGGYDDDTYTGLRLVNLEGKLLRELPSMRLLSVPQDGSNEIVVGRSAVNNLGEVTLVRPMRVNLETGDSHKAVDDAPDSAVGWWFDRLGQARLAMSRPGKGRTAWYLREPGTPGWQNILDGKSIDFPWQPSDIDGQGALYVNVVGPEGYQEFRRWDPKARAPSKDPFVRAPGFDIDGAVVSDDLTGRMLGVRLETDAAFTHWFDAGMQALQDEVDRRLPWRVNVISCRRCSAPDRVALVHAFSPREPGQWFVVQGVKDLRWIEVGRARKRIDPRLMSNVEFHRIKARDGRELPLWLTVPSSRPRGEPLPTVVMVHGGPWMRGGHWDFDEFDQFLASRGYLVINAEFRGSAGYGDAHFRAGFREWGRAMQDDVADALAWAVQQGRADARRSCIAGGSYGGYAALMGVVRHPESYRCAAAWVAVTDPKLMFEPLWRATITAETQRYELPQLIADPVKDADLLREIAPVHQVAKMHAPLLLAFSERDGRVPIDHANALRKALASAGKHPEFVVYYGEGHSWQKAASRIDFARRLERFLAEHTAPR